MKDSNSILSADEFWHYTSTRYAHGDIATLAILLQDNYAVNVNVLLFVCWCLEHGWVINLTQLNDIVVAIAESEKTLIEHRKVRKQMRQQLDNQPQDKHEGLQDAYNALKNQELVLERTQQEIIVTMANKASLVRLPLASSFQSSGVVNASIAAFINQYSLRNEPQARALIGKLIKQLP